MKNYVYPNVGIPIQNQTIQINELEYGSAYIVEKAGCNSIKPYCFITLRIPRRFSPYFDKVVIATFPLLDEA